MPTVQRSITINRPIDEVFAFFADINNDQKWRGRDHVKEISIDGAMRQGARVHQKLAAGPFGAPVTADMDVVTYQGSTARSSTRTEMRALRAVGLVRRPWTVRPRADTTRRSESSGW